MELVETSWGIAVLVVMAWLVASCLFSIVVGRFIAEFGGDRFHEAHKLDQPKRRSPRRAGVASTSRQHKQTKKTSTG